MHGVYKYEVNGVVIYVGKTDSDFAMRIYCHSKEEGFAPYLADAKIYVCEMKDADEADFLETVLINQYKPTLNKAKKNVTNLPVWACVDWISWDNYTVKKRSKTQKRTVIFYLNEDVHNELVKLAKANKTNKSQYLNALLRRVLFNE